MRKILFVFGFLLTGCVDDYTVSKMEQAYFEGQKDALNGQIKIKQTIDSCWVWIDSPWNNGREPHYKPSLCK